MKYLLDTCVVSETISRNPNPVVNGWLDGIDGGRGRVGEEDRVVRNEGFEETVC